MQFHFYAPHNGFSFLCLVHDYVFYFFRFFFLCVPYPQDGFMLSNSPIMSISKVIFLLFFSRQYDTRYFFYLSINILSFFCHPLTTSNAVIMGILTNLFFDDIKNI